VLGGPLGTCFDVAVLREEGTYRLYFSWRPKRSIALVESKDGIAWGKPSIVLGPNQASGWEDEVNRPVVLKHGGRYQMWYTGQAKGKSWIGCAASDDGKTWKRRSDRPVLSPQQPWEKVAVMCPHVLYDEEKRLYRLWYSGGEQYEPNAIGYATSQDGLTWTRHPGNPIFRPDPKNAWEKDRVTGCQVVRHGGWYVMFYIGFRDQHHAQIGLARSKDGVTNWQRHRANPIIRPAGASGTPTRSTSRSRSSTAVGGCCGTTGAGAASSRSAWPPTRARTSASDSIPGRASTPSGGCWGTFVGGAVREGAGALRAGRHRRGLHARRAAWVLGSRPGPRAVGTGAHAERGGGLERQDG
jgi:predicted GH43/DUF377 family glycosyl hydrolase